MSAERPELAAAKQMVVGERQAFQRDVTFLVSELQRIAGPLTSVIGDVSRSEALEALRDAMIEIFEERMRP